MDNQGIDNRVNQLPSTSPDFRTDLAKKLEELVPEAIADGKVDVVKLKELLAEDAGEPNERFGLFWPGKKQALRAAQDPTTATLKPAKDESKDWDTTNNIFIEGDNLEVLKVLQKQYHNSIKMIYIDPPYNTGKDFVYPDNFKEGLQNYLEFSQQVDEGNKKISTNTETAGRYHSNWLNMMYPRLKLARNLLTDDGVIFISIDDNEQANLKKLCDEIFGETNFVTTIHVQLSTTQGMKVKAAQDGNIVKNAEYILCYSRSGHKNIAQEPLYDLRPGYDEHYNLFLREDGTIARLKDIYDYSFPKDLSNKVALSLSEAYNKSNEFAEIVRSHLAEIVRSDKVTGFDVSCDLKQGEWRQIERNGKRYILTLDSKNQVRQLLRLVDSWGKTDGYGSPEGLRKIRGDWWEGFYLDMGNVSKEGGVDFKNGKKPLRLIKQLTKISSKKDGVVLDFFSGSATTAHAVMQLNAEDGGNRKHIMVQLPEPTDEKSEAFKAGYKKISDIARERINRAGEKIKADFADKLAERETPLDVGYRTYKLADTNFTKWQSTPTGDLTELQARLDLMRESSNDNASEEDLLVEVLLKMGLPLTTRTKTVDVDGLHVHQVVTEGNSSEGQPVLYLNEHVKPTLEQLRAIITDLTPSKFVILDDAFQGDNQLKTNLVQTCKSYDVELWTV